jgi:bacterial/archaeal transporter family protein
MERSPRGITYTLLNGILAGVGGLTLFAAYHTDSNTSLVTVVAALYPMNTVVLAVLLSREQFRLGCLFSDCHRIAVCIIVVIAPSQA